MCGQFFKRGDTMDNAENRIYGYARVSTKEQNLDRQIEALKQYVPDERNIITDEKSGKDFQRENYQALKNTLLRKGDTLYIKELDRLGRNYDQIGKEYTELVEKGVNIKIIDMPVLSSGENGLDMKLLQNIIFEILSYIAEKERLKIHSRCAEGIEEAKKRGVKFGRPQIQKPSNWNDVYSQWKNGTITTADAMRQSNLKRNTFYKFVKAEREECVSDLPPI